MNKPHKWAKEIKAWADGAEIESRQKYHSYDEFDEWELNKNPAWIDDIRFEYRIKPQPKEPQYLYVYVEPDTGNYKFSTALIQRYEKHYIGKIKLEIEDEN